jgi:hypothetical protein
VSNAASVLQPGFDAATANNATLMPRVNSALDYSQGVMNGNFLNGNPHLQSVIDASNRDISSGSWQPVRGRGTLRLGPVRRSARKGHWR